MTFLWPYYEILRQKCEKSRPKPPTQPKTPLYLPGNRYAPTASLNMYATSLHLREKTDKNRRKRKRGRTGSTLSPFFRPLDSGHISVGRWAADLSQPGQFGHVDLARPVLSEIPEKAIRDTLGGHLGPSYPFPFGFCVGHARSHPCPDHV